ncbi:hypothetical protein F4776DRAFT_677612 [Hypoxylon sp. NC0597]|nr:hypothetical protein F4776DRAFT_677612 [Hypoxylon sp. NC0597]
MTIVREVPICSSCLQIFSSPTEPSSPPSGYCLHPSFANVHHHSIASLKQAVEDRCPFCIAVAAALPPEPISLSPDKNATSFNITEHENNFRIGIFTNVNDSNRPMFFNAVQVEGGQGNHDTELKGLDLCHRWISDCLRSENPEYHNSCRNHRTRSQTTLRRPSRLIRLRRERDSAQLSYTVLQYPPGQELSPKPLYATVSHLDWTDNRSVTGEFGLENVHSWTSTSQLPTCLHQAARIAFGTGVEYLWTPKLCANHTEDPITTAHIFAGGAFNIAAMACVNSSDPLLFPKELSRIPIVRPQWAPEQALAIYRSESFQNSVSDSPLWDSALFHQGTLLSPATLYCGKDQLWWQCYHGRGALCSEALAITGSHCRSVDNQEGILGQLKLNMPYAREYYKSYANFDPRPPVPFPGAGSSNPADFRGFESAQKCLAAMWTQIITTYSTIGTRTLEERAAVVDGIAECVPLLATPGAADIFGSLSYAYGCWSADLVEQLAWHFVCDDVENRRTLPYRNNTRDRFPTWSWLSLPGKVNFEFPISTHPGIISTNMLPDENFLSPVAKARFSTAEECSAIGVVTAGSVRACGSLIPARVEVLIAEPDPAVLQLEGLGRGYVKWDCRDELDRALGRREASGNNTYRAWPIYVHYYKDREILGARGVLLRRIEKDQCQIFVRCGWFEHQGPAGGDESQVFDKMVDFRQGKAVSEEEFIII